MMIEQNTNYAYKLKHMDNPTFDKVRDLSTKFYRELPKALQEELYETLNHGVDILDSEPQMTTYMYAFGPMHQAKLNYAFNHLPKEFLAQPEINIIDYGCGQALGTMCYADFIREKGYSQKVKTITLIEPSEMCIKRAALYASMFFPDAEIKTINKKFDDLTQDDIVCNEETPTLHILSNVLDMMDFDLEGLAYLVDNSIKGYSQFVCVGPYFNHSGLDNRMEVFRKLLNGHVNFSTRLDKYELHPDKTWTCNLIVYSLRHSQHQKAKEYLFEISTSSDDYDCNNRDNDGAVYSKDGKRIIGFGSHVFDGIYHVKEGTLAICDLAFNNFESDNHYLKGVKIPLSVIVIGENPFAGCIDFKIICDSPFFKITNSMLYDCTFSRLIANVNPTNGELSICCKTKIIGAYSLSWCNAKTVKLPNSIETIEEFSFAFSSIKTISMPNSVTSIGEGAFDGCRSLQQIIIPKGSMEKFKQLLPTELWDKLYYLEKADVNAEDMDNDLPF